MPTMLLDRFLPKASLLPALAACVLLAACSNTRRGSDGDGAEGAAPTDTTSGQTQQDPRVRSAERVELLVKSYLETAEQLRRQGQLEAARLEVLKAKDYAPANDEVLRMLAALNAQLGEPSGGPQSFAAEQVRLRQIKEERAKERVTAIIGRARDAMAREDYRTALEELGRARVEIEAGAFVDWGGLDEQVSELRAEASRQQVANEKMNIERAAEETRKQLLAAEQEREARRRRDVDRLLRQATIAFERRQFTLAQDLAFQALERDPQNDAANTLINSAQKAQRNERNERYFQETARRVRAMIVANDDLRIPQNDILTTDIATWRRATARSEDLAFDASLPVEDELLREKLANETVNNLVFEEEDYAEAKTRLQTITEIPMIITPAAADVIDSEGLTVDLQITAPLTVENLLNQLVSKSPELSWTVRGGVVEITSRELAGGDNIRRVVDVRDLVFPQTVFLPPDITDVPIGDDGGFSEVPRTGGESDEKIVAFEIDTLVSTLQDATGRDYWDGDSGALMEAYEAGYLVVTANPSKHQAVINILNDLRRFSTSVVTIESKFLTITQNFLQEIGVDFRGLGGSGNPGTVVPLDDITNGLENNASRGLDNGGTGDPAGNPLAGIFFNDGGDGDVRGVTENAFSSRLGESLSSSGGATAAIAILDDLDLQAIIRAVEKQQEVQELNGQNLTVLNNGRGHVAVINQTAYIKDFDVEVAQAAFIADPKVDVVQDGIVLDVKPTVNYDRKTITLDLEPTVAELLLPIPTFSTSLAGTTVPVTIQLPRLVVQSFATTATVPDGGSVLIGGLREMSSIERQAEVPILSQIPLISVLFKQEGVSEENSSLMVLVRATITDVLDRMDSVRPR